MNLQTGWIFFIDESGKHSMLVDENLPEALTWQRRSRCVKETVGV